MTYSLTEPFVYWNPFHRDVSITDVLDCHEGRSRKNFPLDPLCRQTDSVEAHTFINYVKYIDKILNF